MGLRWEYFDHQLNNYLAYQSAVTNCYQSSSKPSENWGPLEYFRPDAEYKDFDNLFGAHLSNCRTLINGPTCIADFLSISEYFENLQNMFPQLNTTEPELVNRFLGPLNVYTFGLSQFLKQLNSCSLQPF
jgi:hypothetical protein